MAVPVTDLGTIEDFPIGGSPDDKLVAGDYFERDYEWSEEKTGDLVDFTGYTGVVTIVENDGTVLATGMATNPSAGVWKIVFSTADTTAAPGNNKWKLVITAGAIQKTLVCSDICIIECP